MSELKSVRINISAPEEEVVFYRRLVEKTGVPLSVIIRRAITYYYIHVLKFYVKGLSNLNKRGKNVRKKHS